MQTIDTKHSRKSVLPGLQTRSKPGQRVLPQKNPKTPNFLKQKTSQPIFFKTKNGPIRFLRFLRSATCISENTVIEDQNSS